MPRFAPGRPARKSSPSRCVDLFRVMDMRALACPVTSRGGDYGPDSPAKALDLLEPYLRTVLGFIGIRDVSFVNAQPMDMGGPAMRELKIRRAAEEARAAVPVWAAGPAK